MLPQIPKDRSSFVWGLAFCISSSAVDSCLLVSFVVNKESSLYVYVDDAWQNRGIGTALLSHLCSESEKNGYWSLYSAIFSINESSIKLHEKCGFRVIGTREKIAKDKYGIWQDTTLMEKRSQMIV